MILVLSLTGASGSASDRRHAVAEFARNYPIDPVDVIIADFMSEYNMAVAAGKRVDQESAAPGRPVVPAYELTFLESLEPALGDIARYGIKVAANAGVADTRGMYEMVVGMVERKGLDLKVGNCQIGDIGC